MNKANRNFEVRRTATGLGLFALRDIAAGKRIIEYVGPLVPAEEAERSRGKYFFELNQKHAIDGSPRDNTARYINHSCRPNAEAFTTGRRVWIWSRKNIRAGQEITLDYGEEYFDKHLRPKGCKCARCFEPKIALAIP
ncbi:MAG: SET domain-containing protein [Pyrinomonadaceae bacterium]